MCCTDKTYLTLNNMQHHTGNFQTEIYSILMLCYVLYHTHINFIITTQTSQKLYLCRCKYIPMYRHWTMSLLLCTTMWMCTYWHCDERRKRWAETLQKSHEGTWNLYNKMCWQNMPQWSIVYVDLVHVSNLG